MIPYSVNRAGVVWGETSPHYSYEGYKNEGENKLFNFAAIGGAVGVFGGVTARWYKRTGETWPTAVFRHLQDMEKFFPFQLLATFRFSSMVSPFAQTEKIAPHVEDDMVRIGRDFLGKRTADYLAKISGLPVGTIASRLGDSDLYWKRTGRFHGRLIQKTGAGAERLIADNIGLLYTGGSGGFSSSSINRYAQAYMAVIDDDIARAVEGVPEGNFKTLEDAVKHLYDPDRIRDTKRGVGFLPIGQGSDKFSQWVQATFKGTDLEAKAARGLTHLQLARAVPAFASARMNDLIKQLTEPIPVLQRVLSIKEGTFLANQGRYAGKALMVWGAWTALQSMDWLKRRDNLVAEVGATGAYGTGAALLARKVFGASPKVALAAGAVTAGMSILSPFDEGVVPGLATVATRLNLFRAHMTHAPGIRYVPFIGSEYRGFLEGVMPGMTSPTTAMIGGLALTIALNKRSFRRVQEWSENIKAYGYSPYKPFGQPPPYWVARADQPKTWRMAAAKAWDQTRDATSYDKLPAHRLAQRKLDQELAEELLNTKGFFGRFSKQVTAAFRGASGESSKMLKMLSVDSRPMGMISQGLLRFAVPTIAMYALLGGFASPESPEELKDLYEGREYVPVRKGRWWEMGGTPYEGRHISYWKPHWYRTLTTRAHDKALWGADEDELSPLYKFIAKHFTYELERRNYYTRPYPITSTAFADVPFLGWILAPTVGRLIKPPRLMHTEEWQREGPGGRKEIADMRSSIASNPVSWMGGMPPQSPVSPYAGGPLFGSTSREWGDQAGLVGWTSSVLLESISGTDSFFARDRWLESAANMSSFTRDFWESELGGMLMYSEPIRRFIPKHRREIEEYNPIRNNMPSWIPAHLKYGDPMGRIDQGELLFPGPGYEALYPEVRGIPLEEYPLTHRYNILSNIAPWSASFRRVAGALETAERQGQLSQQDISFINRINERVRKSALRRNFLQDLNEDAGLFTRAAGGATRGVMSFVKDMAAPIEYMAPFGFRPFSKFMPEGNAIEEYERNMVYGTELSFWDKPWRDWFRPAIYTAAHNWGGWNGIPKWREDSRNMLEYFDKLEYYKWNMLEQRAAAKGDKANARQYAGIPGGLG